MNKCDYCEATTNIFGYEFVVPPALRDWHVPVGYIPDLGDTPHRCLHHVPIYEESNSLVDGYWW